MAFVRAMRAANPELRLDIKRVIAEADMVVTHSLLMPRPGDPGLALADYFRLDNGKVVERWDVIQAVPVMSANENG